MNHIQNNFHKNIINFKYISFEYPKIVINIALNHKIQKIMLFCSIYILHYLINLKYLKNYLLQIHKKQEIFFNSIIILLNKYFFKKSKYLFI